MKEKLLDDIDIKILKILQNDARIPVKNIAEQVFISAPTVRARIEEMRSEGVIKGFYADIDCNVIESVIKTYINVDVAPSLKEKLYQFLNDSPCVLECDRVTGEYSLIIKTVFKNTSEMDKFINMLQTFGRTKTQIVFSTIINHRAYIN